MPAAGRPFWSGSAWRQRVIDIVFVDGERDQRSRAADQGRDVEDPSEAQ